jgi:hypothetical protein
MSTVRLLPHGSYALIPAVLTTMAWISALFQEGCDFARASGDIVNQLATSEGTPWLEVGFSAYREPRFNERTNQWEVVYTGACLAYPETVVHIDGTWKVSKGFTFLALVFGGGATFFLWFSTCCIFSRATWRLAGYEVLAAAITQALAFTWFKTEMCQSNSCEMFRGSQADTMACTLWTIAAMFIFCHYPKPYDFSGRDGLVVDPSRQGASNRPTISIEDRIPSEGPTVVSEAAFSVKDDDDTAHAMSSGEDTRQRRNDRRLEMESEMELI